MSGGEIPLQVDLEEGDANGDYILYLITYVIQEISGKGLF